MRELAVKQRPLEDRRRHERLIAAAQVTYAWRDFWRNRVMAFVVLGFPLVFLLLLGISQGELELGRSASDELQVLAPNAIVFASVMASFVMLPFGIAQARDRGVLKRLRGTPLPISYYLGGRLVTAVGVAALGTVVMLAIAAGAFGLEVPLRTVPAMIVTFAVGVACFAALGLAAVALVRGSEALVTVTMGTFLLTAFASGVFAPDLALPRPLDIGSWFLPLRHLTTAFGGTFEATAPAAGFAWGHLGVLLLWTLVGAAVATRWLVLEPRRTTVSRGRRGSGVDGAGSTDHNAAHSTATDPAKARDPGPGLASGLARGHSAGRAPGPAADRGPGLVRLALGQARHANRLVWRQPGSVFFAVAFPVLFAVVVPYAFGQPEIDGVPLARFVVPAMAVFGAVITAYVNLPESVALQREAGILKRLRGTPLPAGAYVLGRLMSALWIGLLTVIAVFAIGGGIHGVTVETRSVVPMAVAFLVGVLTMCALGLAVAALVSDPGSVPAVSLATFMPLAFISDMMAFGVELPPVVQTIAWVFPLKHFVYAVDAGVAGGFGWRYLAGLVAWGVLGAVVAVWRFRWEPRTT